jgi:pyruvate,orthophosphate dikinase
MGELSSPSWREDASPVARLRKTYKAMPDDMNPRAIERRRVEERESAERELLSALSLPRRAGARVVFAGLHAYIPCREFGKASMMMAFDVARAAARTLGGDLVRRGVIEDVEDVFYLTMPEILGSLPVGAKEVIAQRRARRAQHEKFELPDTWVGEPTPVEKRAAVGSPVPSGIGVSPGVVKGRARVIKDIRRDADIQPGEILVCETTDPSWAAYFLVAGGVVTDIGGAMSHGATVSREVGIPCVVNTKTGTSAFRTGDLIEIDGTTGVIEVLETGFGCVGQEVSTREVGDRPAALAWIVDFDAPQVVATPTRALELGGKGANLVEMASVLGLRVPPGFTITTTACREVLSQRTVSVLRPHVQQAVQRIEEKLGQRFGDERAPLLLSVRSGAPASMPGMMDTVLNLGVTPGTVHGLALRGGEAFAWSCYRRFVQMYVKIVLGQRDDVACQAVSESERQPGTLGDRVAAVVARLDAAGILLPADPWEQLMAAVEATVGSWNSERAITYRRIEGIDGGLCTALNVQSMVFGNFGPDSGPGVAFTRDPSTGAAGLVGDYLSGAQGEDVVAGTHRVEPLSALAERAPSTYGELADIASRLERHYRDMCDIEFTIERGVLWLLQVRVGKRGPRAALRIAIDLAQDPVFPLDRREAVTRVRDILAVPPTSDRPLDSIVPSTSLVRGTGASPGVAAGRAWFDPAAVVEATARGERAVLVRAETSPADVHGMADAVAILTATGGLMSHAAVVARAWGKPAVVGVERLEVFADHAVLDGTRIEPRDWLTVDGSLGAVAIGHIEVASEPIPEVDTLLGWAAELGIEIARTPSGAAESVPAPPKTASRDEGRDEDELASDALVVLAIKGSTTPASLAQVLGIDEDRLAPLLERLQVAGHLGEPTPRGLRLSEAGAERVAGTFADTADRLGSAKLLMLESFEKPNSELKTIMTAWQIREINGEQFPNLHDDADHDVGVIERLRDLHVEIDHWLADLAAAAPVIELFRMRLGRALGRVVAGDHRWLVSLLLDSYHTVWFELHECLLRLAGRSRSEEAKAGRAL